MINSIWRELKKTRKIRINKFALSVKFEKAPFVSSNTKARWKSTSAQYKKWIMDREAILGASIENRSNEDKKSYKKNGEFALLVGVGPGFGYALARRLAREGIAVILVSRNSSNLDGLVSEIRGSGGYACAYGCDATSETSVARLFANIYEMFGVPNLVVYSLQNFGPGVVTEIEFPAFEEGLKHNCIGAFLVSKSAAQLMAPLGRGSIILIGSTSSIIGRAGHLNLAAGKFGQRALAQVLARELWPKGIHVAHLLIDADIDEGAFENCPETSSDPNQIAETVLHVHRQSKSAWTSEMDIRPWNEQFWEHC